MLVKARKCSAAFVAAVESAAERDQGLAVVDVGTGDADGQGQTGPLGDQVDL